MSIELFRSTPTGADVSRRLAESCACSVAITVRNGFEVVGDDKVDDDLKIGLTTGVGREVLDHNAASQHVDLDALRAPHLSQAG